MEQKKRIGRNYIPLIFGIYAAVIPFDNVLGMSGLGTLTKMLGIMTIYFIWISYFVNGAFFRPDKITVYWLFFLIFAFTSNYWSIFPAETLLATVCGLFLLYVSISVYPFKTKDYDVIKVLIIAGGIATSLYTIISFFRGDTYASTGRGSIVSEESSVDPNHLCASLIIPAILALEEALLNKNRRGLLLGIIFTLIIFTIFITGSRGGLLGVVFAVLFFLSKNKKILKLRLKFFVYLAVIGTIMFFSSRLFLSNMIKRFAVAEILSSGGAGRLEIWSTGWNAFLKKPFIGYGFGDFLPVMRNFNSSRIQVAHNIYLQILVELGIVGLIIFLFVIWKHWKKLVYLEKYKNIYSSGIQASFLGILVASLTLGTLNYKYFWLAFTLILLLSNIAKKTTKKEQSENDNA